MHLFRLWEEAGVRTEPTQTWGEHKFRFHTERPNPAFEPRVKCKFVSKGNFHLYKRDKPRLDLRSRALKRFGYFAAKPNHIWTSYHGAFHWKLEVYYGAKQMVFFFPFPTSLRSDVKKCSISQQLQAWFRRRHQFNSPKHKLLGQAVQNSRPYYSPDNFIKNPPKGTDSTNTVKRSSLVTPISHREA